MPAYNFRFAPDSRPCATPFSAHEPTLGRREYGPATPKKAKPNSKYQYEHRALGEMGLEQQVKITDRIVDELAHRLSKVQRWVAGERDLVNHHPWGSNRISRNMVYMVFLNGGDADELAEIEI